MDKAKVQSQGEPSATSELANATAKQLSLFDFRPVHRLFCFPMADLHGSVFVRIFKTLRPFAVVDARSHPYFNLTGFNRNSAFEIFHAASCQYLHAPLNLKPPVDTNARWMLRREAINLLENLPGISSSAKVIALLVNKPFEREVLEQALRHSDSDRLCHWSVEFFDKKISSS